MKKIFNCIVCPMSCHLEVEKDDNGIISVHGNSCPRGEAFGKQELIKPMRMLTTTVQIENAIYPLLPVITSKQVPKDMMRKIMKECKNIKLEAPIEMNSVIAINIANSGADLIASRTMEKIR